MDAPGDCTDFTERFPLVLTRRSDLKTWISGVTGNQLVGHEAAEPLQQARRGAISAAGRIFDPANQAASQKNAPHSQMGYRQIPTSCAAAMPPQNVRV